MMHSPQITEVLELAKSYNMIPVVREVIADTETPIRMFQHFLNEPYAFLLESVEGGVKWARYSFIGTNPFLTVRCKNGTTVVREGNVETILHDNPVNVLKARVKSYHSPIIADLPRFSGGAVGFFGYDVLQYFEKLPAHRVDDLQMADVQFMFCDQVIVFDHWKHHVKVIGNVHIPANAGEETIRKAYQETCAKIDALVKRMTAPVTLPYIERGVSKDIELTGVQSNLTKEQFLKNVEKAKEYIRAGDIFQVVLSQRFEVETDVSPFTVYRVLRTLNPSPYMYYLRLDQETIVGASPELLVRVENDQAYTRPIAGTRPRGATPEQDDAFEKDLLADHKELAEHLMLIDLGRNDLGRVCEYGSVRCDQFMAIERYSHVMHIVSNVTGKLDQKHDPFDAFISCMPAGTVSGAPKLRAMEIIAELENESRGSYAGAIGYLGFTGNMDTCITIRTIVFKGNKAFVQAGAGIVWDSVPENEYEETRSKAKAALKAIRLAEELMAVKGATE